MIEPALALLAGGIAAADTIPYLRDTVRRTTTPHRGTWLIWGVLAVVAASSHHADGGSWSLLPLVAQAIGTCLIFAFAVRLGAGGLSGAEAAMLALAGVGVVGWLTVDEPLIATVCVVIADLVGAMMMAPKAWRDPHSETLSLFVLASLGGVATAGAVGAVSVPLLIYPVYFVLVNAALALLILRRRAVLSRDAVPVLALIATGVVAPLRVPSPRRASSVPTASRAPHR